jgi:DNA-binding NtrC family response regulator
VKAVSPEVYGRLARHHWPGNVRELYNALLKSVTLCTGRVLRPKDIQLPEKGADTRRPESKPEKQPIGPKRKIRVPVKQIVDEVKACRGNINWAADNLGISRLTIYRKLKEAGIDINEIRHIN